MLILPSDGAEEEIDVLRLKGDGTRPYIIGRLVIVVRTMYEFIPSKIRSNKGDASNSRKIEKKVVELSK